MAAIEKVALWARSGGGFCAWPAVCGYGSGQYQHLHECELELLWLSRALIWRPDV